MTDHANCFVLDVPGCSRVARQFNEGSMKAPQILEVWSVEEEGL